MKESKTSGAGRNAVKIQPLILLSLSISAVTMGLFAYLNYAEGHSGYGLIFVVLCLFFVAFVVWGLIRNHRLK
ncbi:hypothetical protein EEX84_11720 [Planococcus salinus]|uniref:Uncharacterized protein n=1 Tax=Planococcus salinus TaxID=1848460 RepID=A0A3M8P5V2_9BACL|nr:hypothetical protein EEX84_11720 [Planococcus salinus]